CLASVRVHCERHGDSFHRSSRDPSGSGSAAPTLFRTQGASDHRVPCFHTAAGPILLALQIAFFPTLFASRAGCQSVRETTPVILSRRDELLGRRMARPITA